MIDITPSGPLASRDTVSAFRTVAAGQPRQASRSGTGSKPVDQMRALGSAYQGTPHRLIVRHDDVPRRQETRPHDLPR